MLPVPKHHTMKVMQGQFHTFSTSTRDEGEGSALCSCCFTPKEKYPIAIQLEAGMDGVAKRKI
jgi:hypothetical protein